jgi:hypothetical protein
MATSTVIPASHPGKNASSRRVGDRFLWMRGKNIVIFPQSTVRVHSLFHEYAASGCAPRLVAMTAATRRAVSGKRSRDHAVLMDRLDAALVVLSVKTGCEAWTV